MEQKQSKEDHKKALEKMKSYLKQAFSELQAKHKMEILQTLGAGTYGTVVLALDHSQAPPAKVAIKICINVKWDEIGICPNTIREISIYRHIQVSKPPFIATIGRVLQISNGVVAVLMPYYPYTLDSASARVRLNDSLRASIVRNWMKQLLIGTDFLHRNGVLHRDLKPQNILLDDMLSVHLCDFGLSRMVNDARRVVWTPNVVTRWYRAPELLMGVKSYNSSIDMWSIGCIFGELLTGNVLFNGESDVDTLTLIFKMMGTPQPTDSTRIKEMLLSTRIQFERFAPCDLRTLPNIAIHGEHAIDLLRGLLNLDSEKRLTASNALQHPYFTSELPNVFPASPSISVSSPESAQAQRASQSSVAAAPSAASVSVQSGQPSAESLKTSAM